MSKGSGCSGAARAGADRFGSWDTKKGRERSSLARCPDEQDRREEIPLSSPDTLAVSALGQLAENTCVVALRDFVMSWHLSYLSTDEP
ncbi:MAG: hypothetical protein OXD42_14800 [Rhodospirillaceae bacterium]|nr:hypothetical protein [Rhodospirillaceae bacterium]